MRDFDQWFNERRQRELDQFKVGTEVVVTLHGECRPYVKHGTQEIGVRGMVIGIEDHAADGHTLMVYYRQTLRGKGICGYYTPGELRVFNMLTDIAWTDEERAALMAAAPGQPQPRRTRHE